MTEFYLILGCFGLEKNGFKSCSSVENKILSINTSISDYNDMMNYFDQLYLFDRPLSNYNTIRHFIYNINNRFNLVTKPFWSPSYFNLIENFILQHKLCGVFVRLELL